MATAQELHWDDYIQEKMTRLYASCRTAPYCNVQVLAQYLDTHLVIPLLGNLAEKNAETPSFDAADLVRAQMDVVAKTKMVEYEFEFHQQLNPGAEMPAEMAARRDAVVAVWEENASNLGPLLALVEGTETGGAAPMVKMLADGSFTAAKLLADHEVGPEHAEALFHWAKFRFECGNYAETVGYMKAFMAVNADPSKTLPALWGKLAADLLTADWTAALESMGSVRDAIDMRNSGNNPLDQLQQRTWLMHWSLFVFFNTGEDGKNDIVDMFLNEHYLNAITTNCPHMLRYLAAAVIINKRRRGAVKDLVRTIQTCKYMYSDPVTEFVEALYVDFDFEGAQGKLEECRKALGSDFFLVNSLDEFVENARHLIFETYCKIHQKIDIKMLSTQLGMSLADAEEWIVKLVREAQLDAKIDAAEAHVIMGTKAPDVYQQVIDKTKSLAFRSYVLSKMLEGRGKFSAEDYELMLSAQANSGGGGNGGQGQGQVPDREPPQRGEALQGMPQRG